jgi:hypothetical protein
MKTEINNELIRSFSPCYDPSEIGIPDDETLPVVEWVEKYRNQVKEKQDVIWLICRNEFMSDRDLRLFAVWCTRESYQYCTDEYPLDQRSIDAVDCAERYANGEATSDELAAAWAAARAAAWEAARAAAGVAARAAAGVAARAAAGEAAGAAAREAARAAAGEAAGAAAGVAQIDQLLIILKSTK